MASFSSQGFNSLTPDILKPDITAPGLNILAAWTNASAPTAASSDQRRVSYNVISGTSMSCPHVAGIVALLRALHPTWSPAAIKSAVMTSAKHHDNSMQPIRNGSLAKATPFNYGAGHVNPNAAADPGLVYDASPHDYFLFICSQHYNQSALANITGNNMSCPDNAPSPQDLNYPTFSLSRLSRKRTVVRTVTFVGGTTTYTAVVKAPLGVLVEVVPTKLTFSAPGERQSFRVSFTPVRKAGHQQEPRLSSSSSNATTMVDDWVFGYLTWTDGVRLVTSTLAVNVAL